MLLPVLRTGPNVFAKTVQAIALHATKPLSDIQGQPQQLNVSARQFTTSLNTCFTIKMVYLCIACFFGLITARVMDLICWLLQL
jgi:hypothetical protein